RTRARQAVSWRGGGPRPPPAHRLKDGVVEHRCGVVIVLSGPIPQEKTPAQRYVLTTRWACRGSNRGSRKFGCCIRSVFCATLCLVVSGTATSVSSARRGGCARSR